MKTPSRTGFGAQLAAIVALAAIGGVVAVAGFAVVRALPDLVVMSGCVFIAAFFGWLALIRRGVFRLLSVPFLLIGIALLLACLGSHVVLLLILAGLLMLFGLTGRYALRAERSQGGSVRRHARRAGPARKGVLLINPKSGGGKAERFDLLAEARRRGIEPVLLEAGSDLRELAERAVRDGADVIGMAGGDGSQALVATVAMPHDVAHVCVPAGTRNHLALDLGLDRNDVVGALDAFGDGLERRIDLARVNDHVFVNNASLGVYASVVQSEAYREAKVGTWRRMLPELIGSGEIPIDLRFEGPDAKDWVDATLVLVSNNPYQVKRLAGAGTRPALNTGRLGIVAAQVHSARAVAKIVTLGSVGLSQRTRGMRQWSRGEFEVHSNGPVAVGLDGEALLLAPPLRFESLPGALRVRLPHHAKGVSPAGAAVALSRRDIARLARVAAGGGADAPPQHELVRP